MMHDGESFRLKMPVLLIRENDVGFWPTATKVDSWSNLENARWVGAAPYVDGIKRNTDLRAYLKHLGRLDLAESPKFREWLMGWVMGWTIVSLPLEMDKFQQWLDLHGKS
jgi:hypothetical protein